MQALRKRLPHRPPEPATITRLPIYALSRLLHVDHAHPHQRAYLDGDESSWPRGEAILHASGLPGSAKHPGGGWQRYAVRSPDFKLLRVYQGPRLMSEEAYDLVRDPREQIRTTIPEDRYEALRRELDAFVRRARPIDPAAIIPLDVEAWQKLRALGYVE